MQISNDNRRQGLIGIRRSLGSWVMAILAVGSLGLIACGQPSSAPLPAASGVGSSASPQPAAGSAGGARPAAESRTGSANCPTTGAAPRLDGAGATFPAPLYQRWFAEYKALCAVEVNYQAIGSGGGIQQHTQKTVQFGASDGILTSAQKEAAPGTLAIPTVAGPEA